MCTGTRCGRAGAARAPLEQTVHAGGEQALGLPPSTRVRTSLHANHVQLCWRDAVKKTVCLQPYFFAVDFKIRVQYYSTTGTFCVPGTAVVLLKKLKE